MQKKLIALAVAGLASGVAFADSANVTMYGVADASFEQVSAGGATPNAANTALDMSSRMRANSNNSLIGFKGAESLGNGLTAVFQFETNVNLGGNNGAGAPFGTGALIGSQRDTFIGLAGGFGTVAAGYLSTPSRSTLVQFDVMPGATGAAGINSLLGKINVGAALNPITAASPTTTTNTFGTTAGVAVGGVSASIQNNQNTIMRTTAIAYISPAMNGFQGVIAYVPNTSKDNTNGQFNGAGAATAGAANMNSSAWNLSLNYAAGPLKVGYAYLKANDADLLNVYGAAGNAASLVATGYTGSTTLKTHILGAGYDFGNGFSLNAVYDKASVDIGVTAAAAAGTVNSISRNGWYLGAKYVTGPNEFALAYATMGDNSIGTVGATTNNYGSSGAKQISLRYGYNLSKRTQVYGLYTRLTNDQNGNFDVFNGSGASATGSTYQAGVDPQVFGVGMRHSF